ncbi:hypothetical protein V1512DRAFT_20077 [Lipomyces arxii]|uniref:uncharacterized protein n=1 Tax=Lipomyces arxii TaxID=56418 RepID=UPI0034CFF984
MMRSPQLQALKDRYGALPYITTVVVGIMGLLYCFSLLSSSVTKVLALNPSAVLHGGIHRLITYPLVHQDFFHVFFNVFALVPVLSSFEEETGTVATVGCLYFFSVIPGVVYVLTSLLFSSNVVTLGASGWVFSLMAYFALKDYAVRQTIYLNQSIQIPTWSTPVLTLLLIALLLPGSSFWGHLYGLLVGYAYGLGYIPVARLPAQLVYKVESTLSQYNLTRALPRFVSDESASKHRVVIDTTVDAGVPSGGTSPVLAPVGGVGRSAFNGQGRPLGV